MKASLSLLSLLYTVSLVAHALHLPLEGRRRIPDGRLTRRASLGSPLSVNDTQDFTYTVDITLGGVPFSVIMDTGSSDLWVATDQTSTFSLLSSQTVEVDYVKGAAEGPVAGGTLNLAGFEVQDQAFMLVTPSDGFPAGQGLIGLGPSSGSQVLQSMGTLSGDPPLDRIFQQNTSSPNYITVRLGREDDPSAVVQGDLTIGEPLQQFQNITSQTKLAVSVVSVDESVNQHWQTLIDPDGIIGPDGNAISTPSVAATNLGYSTPNQLAVLFDTGFTVPQVPQYVSDAIYSSVSGAKFQNITGIGPIWVLPCDAEVNVTFKFGGQSIPIHPLDTNLAGFVNDNGDDICVGAFQPISTAAEEPTTDGNLGMAFLRNVYLLIDFGDFIDNSPSSLGEPYIQMLSTTDPATAHQQFLDVRVNTKSGGAVNAGMSIRHSARWTGGLFVASVLGLTLLSY